MLTRFPWIEAVLGAPTKLPLRQFTLNLATFLATVAAGLFFLLDTAFRYSTLHFWYELGTTLVVGLLYGLSRFGRPNKAIVHLTSLGALIFQATNYASNGGILGSGWLGGMMVLGVMAIFHELRWALFYGACTLAVQVACVGLEQSFPWWVRPYDSQGQQVLDLVFSFVFCGLLLFGLILMVMRFYAQALDRTGVSEERLALAMEASRDGHWDWDVLTGRVYYSPTWKKILGYADDELESVAGLAERLTPPEEWRKLTSYFDAQAEAGAEWGEIEVRMWHRSGGLVDVRMRTRMIRDKKGRVVRYIGTHTDVTERNRIIRELEIARLEAERANRAKSEFLSSMSHELRTPMNAILGFGQILEREKSLTASQKQYVGEILGSGQHLLALINDVLDLARIESGRLELTLEPIDGQVLVRESLELVSSLAAENAIIITTSGQASGWILADRVRLTQVLVNLLSNAVKYNRVGGRVQVRVSQEASVVRIAVVDTGFGIPADQMDKLFLPFNRLGREAGDIQGSGIGLAFSKRLVELMNGTIQATSTPGEGSCFSIDLPWTAATPGIAPVDLEPAGGTFATSDSRVHSILYIEDNPSNLRLMESLLSERDNVSLTTATTGLLGLELAEKRRPELVLLDLNLPDIQGYEVLDRLRAQPWGRNLAIVAVTANAMTQDLKRAHEGGFLHYLTKPINATRLFAVIDSIFATANENGGSHGD